MGWMKPFTEMVNQERVNLGNLVIFHMDECLDWQGRLLPENNPFNFMTTMLRHFYEPILPELNVPETSRNWLLPATMETIREKIWAEPIHLAYGGWGQDGHIAYNQARRNLYSQLSLEDLRNASIRIQENNLDTILALAQRNLGAAYQFVPPMSITLGVKECLAARKVRLWSDTGAWKQTALRVALFGPLTPESPLTLLQEHPDALLTATEATAAHPISEHPEWNLGL
jgi:glucosamine-6-phosphate deaminase